MEAKRLSEAVKRRQEFRAQIPPMQNSHFKFSQLPRPPLVAFGMPKPTKPPTEESGDIAEAFPKSGDNDDDENPNYVDSRPVVLVPIKLEFDVETYGFKLRDHFMWNLNETQIKPEFYAQQLCGDFLIPLSAAPDIAKQIKEQLDEFYDHSYMRAPLGAVGTLGQDWIVPIPSDTLSDLLDTNTVKSTPATPYDHPNLRVLLKIDVTIGSVTVMDNLEWDLNCAQNVPEEFVQVLCNELGLDGEFRNAISAQMREQIQMYQKTLFHLEHPFDDSEIDDEDLWYNHFLPPVQSPPLRAADQTSFCGPTVLTNAQPAAATSTLPTASEDKSSSTARRRRLFTTTRTRGRNALPDREVTRLWMTPLPIWRSGIRKSAAAAVKLREQAIAAIASGGTAGTSVAVAAAAAAVGVIGGKRRTRQDAAMEVTMEEAVDALVVSEAGVSGLGLSKQDVLIEWRCKNCNVGIKETILVRAGPDGPQSLCNACGLHYSQHKEMRKVVVTKPEKTVGTKAAEDVDGEMEKNRKGWFPYPSVVDANASK